LNTTPNSGATVFKKGDVEGEDILLECKTLTKKQKQMTIKKEWFDTNEEEAFATGKTLSAVAFNFGDGENYYAVNERDFKKIISKENIKKILQFKLENNDKNHEYLFTGGVVTEKTTTARILANEID